MANQSDHSNDDTKRETAGGGKASQGGQPSGAPPKAEPADESEKGGQIAQDRQQTTGLGGTS